MATHSSLVDWRTPGTEKPGWLQSIRSHDLNDSHTDIADVQYCIWFTILYNIVLGDQHNLYRIQICFNYIFQAIPGWNQDYARGLSYFCGVGLESTFDSRQQSLCGWVRSVHPTLPIAVAALVADCETKGHVKMGKENITSWSPYRSSFLPECATWQRIGQCGLAFHGPPVFECVGSRWKCCANKPSKMYRCDFSR